MSTTRLMEKLYQITIHEEVSLEDEEKMALISEFLSIFDFLWNHSESFMEIVDISNTQRDKMYGKYNTTYAQFFRTSFENDEKTAYPLSLMQRSSILEVLRVQKLKDHSHLQEYTFHDIRKRPVAEVHWQHAIYPEEITPGFTTIFGIGVLIRKIRKQNFLVRFFLYLFRKN